MIPFQRRNMGDEVVRDWDALIPDELHGSSQVGGIPQDDRVHDEIEAGGMVGHGLGGAVAQFAEPMEEDGPSQGMAAFPFVEIAMGAPPQLKIEQPVTREDGSLDPANLAQRLVQPVLPRIGGDLPENDRR